MKILHYTLGFQPSRTGGLVKYAEDLMNQQVESGYKVIALYPGRIKFFSHDLVIKSRKSRGFECYELINSLPLALFGGFTEPDEFMKKCDKRVYYNFLKKINPDVIHVHSLMGIHKEFFESAQELGIKIFFTSHDYYGLAPVPNFFFNGVDYSENNTNISWNIMSSNALSVKKLRFFQIPFYPIIRRVLKLLGKNPKSKVAVGISKQTELINYIDIRSYYKEMFNLIDAYLFNSRLARDVYIKNGVIPKTETIISISNSSIRKRNILRKNRHKKVIAYIGPDEDYKGYFDFIDLVNDIDKENYEIKTYGHLPNEECPSYIQQNGYFTKKNIDTIYSDIDILIVPSKWKETFGFITIEALSYGVKVFVSENVGSKDLLSKSYVFRDKQDLLYKIQSTDYEEQVINTMKEHMIEVKKFYERIINEYKKNS